MQGYGYGYGYVERVRGVLPQASINVGLMKNEEWILIVTDRRLIGAKVTADLMKTIIQEARDQAKARGSGFFGQWGAQLKVGLHIAARFQAMPPDAIVAETAGNWCLYPGQVSRIRVQRRQSPGDEDSAPEDYLKIEIETPGGKGTYTTSSDGRHAPEIAALLGSLFGPIVSG
jgi:hypothetical protein